MTKKTAKEAKTAYSQTEILPSINVADFDELKEKIRLVEEYTSPTKGGVKWAHIDVSDGTFTKHISWHEPKDLVELKTKLKLEVHLMIDKPEATIDEWLLKQVSRIIFHQEATRDHKFLIDKIHDAKKEAGIAIRPDTSWLKLFPYLKKVEVLQLLSVPPGPSGQEFGDETIHKIGHIRSVCKECIIEIDGGVTKRVAARVVREGANILVSANYIFSSGDIGTAIRELKQI